MTSLFLPFYPRKRAFYCQAKTLACSEATGVARSSADRIHAPNALRLNSTFRFAMIRRPFQRQVRMDRFDLGQACRAINCA